MAGHSKWAQIKRKKAVTDARRGQLWTRLLREITVAARLGGGDPDGNARLRTAIQEARSSNVPNDNIDRAIKKGTGELEGTAYEEVVYEGYAPGGVAVLVKTLTDNRNRTVSEVRHLFSRHGGNLGEAGSVMWQFDQRGYVALPRDSMPEEEFMELAIELGVDDIEVGDESYEMFTPPDSYGTVLNELERREIKPLASELGMAPKTYVQLDAEHAGTVMRLMEALEEQDDVQNVWANFDVDPAVLAAANA